MSSDESFSVARACGQICSNINEMNSKIYDKRSQQRAKQNMNLIHGEQPIKFMALNYGGGGDESEFGGFSRYASYR